MRLVTKRLRSGSPERRNIARNVFRVQASLQRSDCGCGDGGGRSRGGGVGCIGCVGCVGCAGYIVAKLAVVVVFW